ncbi:hypothetical protein SB776_36125, partial [Burkholderia sp. SIMBA_045]
SKFSGIRRYSEYFDWPAKRSACGRRRQLAELRVVDGREISEADEAPARGGSADRRLGVARAAGLTAAASSCSDLLLTAVDEQLDAVHEAR